MNSIAEYSTLRIKQRQSISLQLIRLHLNTSNKPETSIACYYFLFFLQRCAMFIDGFITQRDFIKSFAIQQSYSHRFIKAAISFIKAAINFIKAAINRNKEQPLGTSNFSFERYRCPPLIELPMLLTTVSGEKTVVFIGSILNSTAVLSIHLPH